MRRIQKWIKATVDVCGGWLTTMSGAVSIPCALVALILGGSPQKAFAVLAYVSLLFFAIRTVITNHGKLEELRAEHQTTLTELRAKHEITVNELQTKNEATVKELQRMLDDKERRATIQMRLGAFHIRLSNRRREIQGMAYWDYYNKYESDMVNHKLDSNSAAIIAEVENVLIFEVPGSSLALFQDRTDLKKTPVDENVSQVVIGKLRMWQAVLDELDNRISQLMKIIQAERTTPSSQF